MATPTDNSVPLTGISQIDALTQGSSWQFGGGAHLLSYSFSNFDKPGAGAWTGALISGTQQAFASWSNVANLTFVESGSGGVYKQSTADIAASLVGNYFGANIIGLGVFPSPSAGNQVVSAFGETRVTYPRVEGDIFFNQSPVLAYLNQGGVGFETIVHEIGHALGLKHPHDNGLGTHPTFAQAGISANDNTDYTVMSYNSSASNSSGNAATPMLFDILAIQQIYGANMSYHTGNDGYVLSSAGTAYKQTIWDAGGIDTLDASGITSGGVMLDLHAGSVMHFGSSVTDIAYNVTIENAVGTAFADTLIGNDGGNTLNGGGGADTMSGGAGNDTYVVDNASDVVNESAGQGTDTVQSTIGYVLGANLENLTLTGSANINGIGNALDNVITGNSGNNTLTGGLGNDTYVIQNAGDLVTENAGEGNDTIAAPFSLDLASFSNAENIMLTGSANINATGNSSSNVLTGNSGNNILTGGGGDDTLVGGAGVNTLDGGLGNDTVQYMGPHSAYAVMLAPNGALAVSAPPGSSHALDQLTGIETLAFSDGSFAPAAARNDILSYTASYPDLCQVFGIDTQAAFNHYISYGYYEGRFPSFNGLEYIASYPDLVAAFGADKDAGAIHYIDHGLFENRSTQFNALEYIASYPDLIVLFGADTDAGATHYVNHGLSEHRSTQFNALEYIASHLDLIVLFGADKDAGATHYILHGYAEHRVTNSFNPAQYLANYPDLQALFGNNYQAATIHYISHGYFEGRTDHPLSAVHSIGSAAYSAVPFGASIDAVAALSVERGSQEGRGSDLNALEYVASRTDSAAAFGNDCHTATLHDITFGHFEIRTDHTLI